MAIIDIRNPLKRKALVVLLVLPALVATLAREWWIATKAVAEELPGAVRDAWKGR